MDDLQELILYENENTRLDFKREEYRKENYSSLLKDVLAFANANTKEDRFIIIGLKPKSSEDRGFYGIKEELTDAATYQQLVFENIEPEISIDYFPYNFQEYILGVLKVSGCNNPPYLMKKDYGDGKNRLYRGEGFIRKGTHQTRLMRADYDKYSQTKITEKYFNEEVEFTFSTLNCINEIELISIDEIERPSQIQKVKIEKILQEKRKEAKLYKKLGVPLIAFGGIGNSMAIMHASFNRTAIPYENRDIETLEENLKDIESTYLEEDYYVFFEENTNKCNISIYNKGHKYIEDASLILKIPKLDGILVLDKVYKKPKHGTGFGNLDISHHHYPQVSEDGDYYIIKDSIGDVKHQLNRKVFDVDLRIYATTKIRVESFVIFCELFAKNIMTSISQEIIIKTRKRIVSKEL